MFVFTVEGYEDCIVRSVYVWTELKTKNNDTHFVAGNIF